MLPPTLRDRLRLPAIGAPLFIVSNPDLVIAQCKAGIVGAFPSLNARPVSQLDEWLHRITEELGAWDRDNPEKPAAPFAVNQIVHKTNNRLEEDVALCVKWKAPIVITSLGAREDVNAAVHSYGGITMHDVINDRFARKAVEKGADGLIGVAAGAAGFGGHAGMLFRPSHSSRTFAPGSTGRWLCRARSPPAPQSSPRKSWARISPISARPSSRPRRPNAAAASASRRSSMGARKTCIGTNLFTGIFGNYLHSVRSSTIRPRSRQPARNASAKSKMSFASASSSSSEAKAWRDIWGSGQGIGAVKSVQSVAELVARLEREYSEAKAKICG